MEPIIVEIEELEGRFVPGAVMPMQSGSDFLD